MAKRNGRTGPRISTYGPSAIRSRTIGSTSYRWPSSQSMTLSTPQGAWRRFGPTTTSTYQCNWNLQRSRPPWGQKYWPMQWLQTRKRLTGSSKWTCLRLIRGNPCTLPGKKWLSSFERKCSFRLGISKRTDHQRSSITSALDRTR